MIWNTSKTVSMTPQPCQSYSDCWLLPILAQSGYSGWQWSLWSVLAWLAVLCSKAVFFLTLCDSINDIKYFRNYLHHTSAVPQPFSLLVAANLAQAGFLGWKSILWPVPNWLAVQRSKTGFFLTLYDSIKDMKYFWNCLHYTSAVPQPFLLLIAANLALAGCLVWKWSLWPVPAWLELQQSKAFCFLNLHDVINDIKHFLNVCITPQPCQSHFCCWLLPIWP